MENKIYLSIIYVGVGVLFYNIIVFFINRFFKNRKRKLEKTDYSYKKLETTRVLFKNIVKYIILIIVLLALLPFIGVEVQSLIAGLGIAGVVMGLAFQDILKDIFAGVGIILESQFAIGDIVQIGPFKGEVVFLGLKTTRIRGTDGSIKIVANRNISELINFSIEDTKVHIYIQTEQLIEKLPKLLDEYIITNKFDHIKENIKLHNIGVKEYSNNKYVHELILETKYHIVRENTFKVYTDLDKYLSKNKIQYLIEVQTNE